MFKKNQETGLTIRNNESFQQIDLLVLDIDDGMTIEEAKIKFAEYSAIIGTSKSHQKIKNKGKSNEKAACDRFRVIIPLEGIIDKAEDYLETWLQAQKSWPQIDTACKDLARFYYPCKEIIWTNSGKSWPIFKGKKFTEKAEVFPHNKELGELRPDTLKFITFGAKDGEWHKSLVTALYDLKQCGYSKEEAKNIAIKSTIGTNKKVDQKFLQNIEDIYNKRKVQYTPGQGSIYVESSKKELIQNIQKDRERRRKANASALPFLCKSFDGIYRLTMGFILLAAKSGKGKSTILANIVGYLVKNRLLKKKVLIVTNEESTEDVYSRIACYVVGVKWTSYRLDELSDYNMNRVDNIIMTLTEKIVVESLSNPHMDFTTIEDVKAGLNYVRGKEDEFCMVLLDYWQTVNQSKERPNMSTVEISKELGFFMKEFAASVGVPTLAFAQLKSNADSNDIKDRIENDRTLYNHAQDVIEIVPNFEKKISTFYLHKNRWGDVQGAKVQCRWFNGHFDAVEENV